jgi:hypothetical protein
MSDVRVVSRKAVGLKKRSSKSALNMVILQPWFLPRNTCNEILRLLPPEWKRRMRYYYDDYGCMRCDRKDVPHQGCGLCEKCSGTVARRLRFSVKRHFKKVAEAKPFARPRELQTRVRLAQKLLSGISKNRPTSKSSPHEKNLGRQNPARQLSGWRPQLELIGS